MGMRVAGRPVVSKKRNGLGVLYRPVSTADVLRAVLEPRHADDVGAKLWPHLHGRGPSRGGPSACYATAARMLGRLRQRRLVDYQIRDFAPGDGRDHRWTITAAGRRLLEAERK